MLISTNGNENYVISKPYRVAAQREFQSLVGKMVRLGWEETEIAMALADAADDYVVSLAEGKIR